MATTEESIGKRVLATWRSPRSFTAIIPLEGQDPREAREALSDQMEEINSGLARVNDLHFFRAVVIRPSARIGAGTRVIVNTIHEAPLSAHLQRLEEEVGTILADVFQIGKPGLADLLISHRVQEDALYIGAINKRVADIRREKRLQEALSDFADKREAEEGWVGLGAEESRRLFQEYAKRELTSEDYPQNPPESLAWKGSFLKLVDLVLVFAFFPIIGVLGKDMKIAVDNIQSPFVRSFTRALMWVWWLWGGIFSGIALLGVRLAEWMEEDIHPPAVPEDELRDIEEAEDKAPHNELTVCFPVRNSWWGRTLLRIILFGSERGTRHFWTRGRLAGAQNIHFARLLQIDRGHSMIFMSDYAGSFDAYVDHFVGIGGNHRAVVPISSRLEGCPKTNWLYIQKNPPVFRKQWKLLIRSHQARASLWYSAYPGLTTNDILANSALRSGLYQERMTEEEASQWLRLLK